MDLLSWIVIGLIAGWLASRVLKGSGYGLVGDTIIGVVGALVGGYIATQLLKIPHPLNGLSLETLIVAFLGSILVIYVLHFLPRITRM
jgi:uncharacterized membrane protein YeaQ/YmgE (transglycosylase-associated protein family)